MSHPNARLELVPHIEAGWPQTEIACHGCIASQGKPVLRYDYLRPGDFLHLDVKKIGRIPDGGGKCFAPGFKETGAGPHLRQRVGFEYLHTAIGDHSRVAYVEALPDEKAHTTAAFLRRAIAYFKRLGVRTRRILTDNARNYAGCAVRAVVRASGIAHKRTRAYCPGGTVR